MVDKLEKECERRREEVEALQGRLDKIMQDGEAWRSDLERREQRVKELEAKMEEWERKRQDAGEQRERLGSVVDGVEQAKRELETSSSRPSTPTLNGVNGLHSDVDSSIPPSPTIPPSTSDLATETQLASLQETHAATLADLSSVTSKYRDALREISDLAAQIQEAKLHSPDVLVSPDKVVEAPNLGARRRMTGDGPTRRLFFRQAASTESLHSR
jgi:DNA repair exonuclease SbcCD ATPase subunit